MRVVLDTNVLISSFIARGTSHRVLEHCVRYHTIITSQFILDELTEKLVKKFKYRIEIAEEAVNLLRSRVEVVVPAPLALPVCRDPNDDMILATALTGSCECIITGDKDLLILKTYERVELVSPGEFAASEEIG